MNQTFWRVTTCGSALGCALLLFSQGANTQPGPYGYHQWYSHNWQAPNPYYRPYGPPMMAPMMGPGHPGALYNWASNGMGASSNLQDMGDFYLLQMRLPGVTSEELNISVNGQVVTIAIQASTRQGSPESGQWSQSFQNMQQTFSLPQPVDSSRMQGKFENGVLNLMIPKSGRMMPKQ